MSTETIPTVYYRTFSTYIDQTNMDENKKLLQLMLLIARLMCIKNTFTARLTNAS